VGGGSDALLLRTRMLPAWQLAKHGACLRGRLWFQFRTQQLKLHTMMPLTWNQVIASVNTNVASGKLIP
jgi:hypothetical protein